MERDLFDGDYKRLREELNSTGEKENQKDQNG
jgi:hypothetical protein